MLCSVRKILHQKNSTDTLFPHNSNIVGESFESQFVALSFRYGILILPYCFDRVMPSSSIAYAQRLFCKVLRSRHFKNLKDIETNRLSSCSFGKIFDHKNWSIFVLYIIKLSRFQRVCIFSFLHKQKLIVVIIVRSYCLRLTHALSAYFTGFCPLGINA